MKNGLLFVLLMAALVAMAVPAGAVAPTIQTLPTVIVGDAEEIAEATNAVLLKYVNVFNLNDKTNEPNSGDPSKLQFWYETTGTKLKVGTPLVKSALTSAEVTALKANSPTKPPAAKELIGGANFWLSLIQDAPGPGKTSATDISAATATNNGALPAELTTAGATGKHSVTLYAIDDVLTSKSWAQASFDVYSLTGGITDSYSPIGPDHKTIVEYTFEGTNDQGWFYSNPDLGTDWDVGAKAQTATAIGHTGASGGLPRYASWGSPVYGISAANMSGRYFVGTMQLSGTAASAAAAPGFRLLYADGYYMHVGGMQILSNAGITAFNAPYASNNRTLKLAWALPTALNEYSDTGKMNKVFEPANDLRSYSILFQLMKMDSSDSGNIMLENCLIESVARPADTTPVKEWGGTGIAFNAAGTGWAQGTTDPTPSGDFGNGTGSITAASITEAIAGTNTGGWTTSYPVNALDATRPAWTTGKMVRTTYKVAASDSALVPNFRMLTIATYKVPIGIFSLGGVYWGDSFSYDNARTKVTPAQSPNGLPGAPTTAGSVIETYQPSQTAGTGAEDAILTPEFDMVQAKGATYPANGWARPSATLTVTSVKMEVLDQSQVLP